jgi:hypothetical protein
MRPPHHVAGPVATASVAALFASLAVAALGVRATVPPTLSTAASAPPATASNLPAPSGDLQAQVDQLHAQVTELSAERDRLANVIGHFDDLYAPMEADRLLLSELRKDIPQTRNEANAYLARLQQLSVQSDSIHLGPPAQRMMDAAPAYLDWRDQDFATQEEAARAFVDSGAAGFGESFVALRNAILLTVANRLDAVLTGIDRAR